MNTLIFKNIGWFAEEDSARYEAIVNEHLKMIVWKCPVLKGFRFSFLTHDNHELTATGDYIASLWNKATKKDVITILTEIINEPTELELLTQKAIYLKKQMDEHLKNNS